MEKKIVAIVCPVYNEEQTLEKSVSTLINFLEDNLKNYSWYVCVVDNASTDSTSRIAKNLENKYTDKFQYLKLKDKGKGLAVRTAWMNLNFDFSIYMDIDLSTDISSILPSLTLLENGTDLIIGSRKAIGAKVINRPIKREFASYIYITIAKLLSSMPDITDFQCGFKGLNKMVALNVLPSIIDNTWYFDSELIINAHKLGYDVKEVPVTWIDDPSTTVKINKVTQVLLFGLYRNLSEKSWLTGGKPKNINTPVYPLFFDHFVESIKFLSVGTFCFLLDLVIATVYQHFAPDILGIINLNGRDFVLKDIYVAVTLGFLLSVPFNFYFNRVFTFQKSKEAIFNQILKFIPIIILGILIKVISAYIWTDFLGLYKVLAVPFSSIIMLISNYLGHKFFTFSSKVD